MGLFDFGSRLPAKAQAHTPLSLEDGQTYRCPVCRHGQIQPMPLMDAFSCGFCRHIFEANLTQQTVQMVDGSQPMAWRWTGRRWQSVYQRPAELPVLLWLIGMVLVIIPAGLVSLSAYIFPPLPGSPGAFLPVLWAGGTLATHAMLVGWLLAEYYQFPPYVLVKVWIQRLMNRYVS